MCVREREREREEEEEGRERGGGRGGGCMHNILILLNNLDSSGAEYLAVLKDDALEIRCVPCLLVISVQHIANVVELYQLQSLRKCMCSWSHNTI